MFDIFYFGKKPELFAHERFAANLEQAAELSKTAFYWFIYGDNNYSNFDFEFRPPPWEAHQIHVWGNRWQIDAGVYFAPKNFTEKIFNYHDEKVHKLPILKNWKIDCTVDTSSIDFAWYPDPLAPPYIYHFPSHWQSASGVTYTVPGATKIKLVDHFVVKTIADKANWFVPTDVDAASIDFTWHPNPLDPPYIYHFPSQWQSASGVTYTVPGAIKVKLVDHFVVKTTADKVNWFVPINVNLESIDFTWHPNPLEPPYIYHFPSQWQSASGVTYTVPGATEVKLIDDFVVKTTADKANWCISTNTDAKSIDFTWHPNPLDPPYIYHFPSQWQAASGVTYTVPGATEVKLIDQIIIKSLPSNENWDVPNNIELSTVDFAWYPNPLDPPYIYHFPSQWQAASGVTYTVPGATEIKLVDYFTVKALPQPGRYRHNFAISEFDHSWHPDVLDPDYCYVFGNQWNSSIIEPTVVYNVNNSQDIKFMDEPRAQAAADTSVWKILDDIIGFDYTWRPDPNDPPYIYVFGNQWMPPEIRPALQYAVPGATEIKYMDEPKAQRKGDPKLFLTHYDCDFDYSWEPNPGSPAYIYVFGNQHWSAEIMPTVQYAVAGATEFKYMDEPRAQLRSTQECWTKLTDLPVNFDRSWCPDPGDPPFIYQFGNQWYSAEVMPTIEYTVAGATKIKYVDTIQARLLPVMDRWTVPEEVDSTNIDFSWAPHPKDDPYIHHFGSDYQISTGLTYTVPSATEPKFEGEAPRLVKEKSTVAVVDIFYIDRGNSLAQSRYERLQEQYPDIQKVRYANSMLETVRRCVTRAKTRKFWVISSMNVYDDFDFAWHAEPWQSYMTHVFPSQWNKWSDTYLINRYEFERHSKWAKGIEEFPNLHFVRNQTVKSSSDGSNIYYVDHGNNTNQLDFLQTKYSKIRVTRFVDNYLDTFKRIMATAVTEYVWIINSVCDYTKFDFTWHPEAWQAEMIHVFPSGPQRRGDTFYIHVESFKNQMYELEILDWFNVINYCEDQTAPRHSTPIIHYQEDTVVNAVKNTKFDFPYAMFVHETNINILPYVSPPCLWHAKDRIAEPITSSGSTSLIPREARSYVKTQLYDYPYVDKNVKVTYRDQELDIIFISNGEPDEELMYHHTEYMTNRPVKWIRGVNGRIAAYQAAARASDTPWFFAVFAKLEVAGGSFPWDTWQPDYWQEPKHYIFNALNPVNGLEYGHQGMIAYNKRLVLENNNPGIDFTLSQPHESVPLLSGTAQFNQDPWTTWRTAFREVVKLKHFIDTQPTLETEHRLDTWLTVASGDYSEWCLRGASDAVSYYEEVGGDYNMLMLSFEWAWLQDRFKNLYNE
jgi:hypothetical protein